MTHAGRTIWAVAAAGLLAWCCAGPPKAARHPARVLLITLDTTRADRLGCYGYAAAATPGLDALARSGARFERAYTHVPLTLPSHCSILTGLTPPAHQVRNNGFYRLREDVPTLAELLRQAGFKTAAFVSSFTLDSRFGLDRGFDVYDDTFGEGEVLKSFRSERKADEVADRFLSWLDGKPGPAFFAWVHFYDPHLPYDPPPPFTGRGYDGEIAVMDAAIGRILRALAEAGLLEDTLVIAAGDHGEALGERGEIDHGLFLYDNTVRVPLLISWPSGMPGGRVVPSRVRLTDILPTVLDLAGLPKPGTLQGVALGPWLKDRRRDDLPIYLESFYPRENFGWSELAGLVDGPWKYVRAPRPELYDLAGDAGETSDRAAARPEVVRRLDERLARTGAAFARPLEASIRRVSTEESERLRSLGYLGGVGTGIGTERPLADPKDKIEAYLTYCRAHLMEGEGRIEAALDGYRRVLAADPDVPGHYVNVAFMLMKLDRVAEALDALETAARRFPGSPLVLSRLMTFQLRAERWTDALATAARVLEIEPRDFDALFLSGSALAMLGRWDEALDRYSQALAVEPENAVLRQRHAYALAAVGRGREALEAYARLKADRPDDPAPDLDIAKVHESLGDLSEAVEWLEKYLASPASDPAKKAQARVTLKAWRARLGRD